MATGSFLSYHRVEIGRSSPIDDPCLKKKQTDTWKIAAPGQEAVFLGQSRTVLL
jgi:hypothetical protein